MDSGPVRMEEDVEMSVAEIALLIDNLKSIDLEARLRSVQNIALIATALGPVRTRDELLPFVVDTIDDEEEIQACLAAELKKFPQLVGGPEHVHCLVPALEALVSAEDASVRDKAVDTLSHLISVAAPDSLLQFAALFRKLADGQWFTTRSVAATIAAGLYRRVPATLQNELLKRFAILGQDTTPMVRRAVAAALKDLIAVATDAALELTLSRILADCARDAQDSVRLNAAGCLPSLALRAPASALPLFTTLAADESWRVRYMVADSIIEFQAADASEATQVELVRIFVALLADKEAEVRGAAAGKVFAFCKALGPANRVKTIHEQILPCLVTLCSDSSEHTRSALAGVIMGLGALVGKDITVQSLLPLFLLLLKDETSDVRLNIISHLEDVNKVIGIGQLTQALLPAVQELAAEKAWRVRQAIIDNIPLVARQLGAEFFNEHLMPLCKLWLQDPIFSVRRSATGIFSVVAAAFGAEWLKLFVMPLFLELSKSANFMHRLTSVMALNAIVDHCDKETLRGPVLSVVIERSRDSIPNIKINTVKTLLHLGVMLERSLVETTLRTALVELAKDSDRDVQFAAICALEDLHLAR